MSNGSATDLLERAAALHWEPRALAYAAAWCLSDADACDALRVEERMDPIIRQATLRKICFDLDSRGFTLHHRALIDRLFASYPNLPAERRTGCGYALSYLYDHLPSEVQGELIALLLQSDHRVTRLRAYKKLRATWAECYLSIVGDAWFRHGDPECALLISEQFPSEFLLVHLTEICEALRPWAVSKMFLRLAPVHPECLSELAEIDEVSLAYVRAKLEMPFAEDEAIQIANRHAASPRIGLLIWSFGRMRLQRTLEYIVQHADEFQTRYISALMKDPSRFAEAD
jgi:hypothetical protein